MFKQSNILFRLEVIASKPLALPLGKIAILSSPLVGSINNRKPIDVKPYPHATIPIRETEQIGKVIPAPHR
jgi:hypothetical protein